MPPVPESVKILERINKSGFLLQMALEHHVKASRTGWRVSTREHHWKNERTGQEGWIDLILEKRNVLLVVECKRAIGGKWAFLVESSRKAEQAKCRVVQNRFIRYPSSGNTHTTTTVDEILLEPYAFQSE